MAENIVDQIMDAARTAGEEMLAAAQTRYDTDLQAGRAALERDVDEQRRRGRRQAEEAAQRVLSGESSIKLAPQRSYVRRLQHMLGQRYNVASTSRGREPSRAVMFYRP